MLPLVLLALLLQAGASVAAARAQVAALDPFASIPICSPDKGGTQGSNGGPSPASHHGDRHCGACLIGALANTPLPPPTAAAVYPDAQSVAAGHFLVRHALPRGPPQRAPNARGPPALA
jgi:hypothetical protein